MEISQKDALWMVTEYNHKRGYGRVNDWIDYHLRAMSIIKGQQVGRPSCSCEFGAIARMANSMYEQHEATLQAIAYPPVIENERINEGQKTKGRPKR